MDSILQAAVIGLASLPVAFSFLFGQSLAVLESSNEIELAKNMTSPCGNTLLTKPALVESTDLTAEGADRLGADVRTICVATNAIAEASQTSN